jgi:hypothetical protein
VNNDLEIMDQYRSNFSKCELGSFSEKSLKKAFINEKAIFQVGAFTRLMLLLCKKVSNLIINKVDEEYVLSVSFDKGKFGAFPGSNWRVPFIQNARKCELTYKFRFSDDFDFARGGKLPGLAGGSGNSGGKVPSGFDGWSVRFMYKEFGLISAYLYHLEMKDEFGEKVFLAKNGEEFKLKVGVWNELSLAVNMNDVGKNNGTIVCKVNGEVGLELNSLQLTKTESVLIDHFLFSCFMGGGDITYAPSQNQHIMFKDFFIQY